MHRSFLLALEMTGRDKRAINDRPYIGFECAYWEG